jgi:hypothetical protein
MIANGYERDLPDPLPDRSFPARRLQDLRGKLGTDHSSLRRMILEAVDVTRERAAIRGPDG